MFACTILHIILNCYLIEFRLNAIVLRLKCLKPQLCYYLRIAYRYALFFVMECIHFFWSRDHGVDLSRVVVKTRVLSFLVFS